MSSRNPIVGGTASAIPTYGSRNSSSNNIHRVYWWAGALALTTHCIASEYAKGEASFQSIQRNIDYLLRLIYM